MAKPTNYTWEEREQILKRMLPPENISIQVLAEEIGVTKSTLYTWRKKINNNNIDDLSNKKEVKNWSSKDKFHIVMETYALNEADLAVYCRQKGLYIEQVNNWSEQCLRANNSQNPKDTIKFQTELKEEKNRSKQLEKELTRKEKALAEVAALLVLQKKAQAIWGDREED
ncbi:helix-turn-helix domain-containing protein [Marinisporobacter balticus]|uniref:Transposase n=1 Tax=Marinisporobacter balticus TaxID=2018667 RepID=A0A4R2K674_9FIRM|nr:helix-turn-helix domain-containing protein [Marinisporobacter balticus]TCO68763.1 transposase [Marinisporobacter balticus]